MATDYDALKNNKNVAGFLNLIAKSEGTASKGDNGYNVLFGGKTFTDYSDHPRQKKSFTALSGKKGKTTAAGRYGILSSTWDSLKDKIGAKDFSPANQDKAAIELIRQAGALDDVENGDYQAAIRKLGNIWASFPSSPYDQPKHSMGELLGASADSYLLPEPTYGTSGIPEISGMSSSQPDVVGASPSQLHMPPNSNPGLFGVNTGNSTIDLGGLASVGFNIPQLGPVLGVYSPSGQLTLGFPQEVQQVTNAVKDIPHRLDTLMGTILSGINGKNPATVDKTTPKDTTINQETSPDNTHIPAQVVEHNGQHMLILPSNQEEHQFMHDLSKKGYDEDTEGKILKGRHILDDALARANSIIQSEKQYPAELDAQIKKIIDNV